MLYFQSNSDPTGREFPIGRIEVRKAFSTGSDLWGPHRFEFQKCSAAQAKYGLLPFETSISNVTVKSYLGSVKPSSDLSDFTEITTLIDPAYTPTIENENQVLVKVQWPGDSYKGQTATLIFLIELNTGGTHPFFWERVHIL